MAPVSRTLHTPGESVNFTEYDLNKFNLPSHEHTTSNKENCNSSFLTYKTTPVFPTGNFDSSPKKVEDFNENSFESANFGVSETKSKQRRNPFQDLTHDEPFEFEFGENMATKSGISSQLKMSTLKELKNPKLPHLEFNYLINQSFNPSNLGSFLKKN